MPEYDARVTDDDAKRVIQERRDRFIAEAMKERGVEVDDPESHGPQMCLSIARHSPTPPGSERGERRRGVRWGRIVPLVILGVAILLALGAYLVVAR